MPTMIEITDAAGALREPGWLARAEAVHRQLRPHLPQDYADKMRSVFAQGGRMIVAVEGEAVRGLAVYRVYENTFDGRFMYVDDLVTDEAQRSKGTGRALLNWAEARARKLECARLTLDSGVQRQAAHRFYFREGYAITSFHFAKTL